MAQGRPFDANRAATLVERLLSFALREYEEAYVAPEHMPALLVGAVAELAEMTGSERSAALLLALLEEPDAASVFESPNRFTIDGVRRHLLRQKRQEAWEVEALVRSISARATAFRHGLSDVRREPQLLIHRLAAHWLSQKPPQACCRCGASDALLATRLRRTSHTWSAAYGVLAHACHACLMSRMRAPMTSAELASRGYLSTMP